ncbi:type 2 periplasmic-binding domain-containing protein [Endothiovibrio diazotrophicus]
MARTYSKRSNDIKQLSMNIIGGVLATIILYAAIFIYDNVANTVEFRDILVISIAITMLLGCMILSKRRVTLLKNEIEEVESELKCWGSSLFEQESGRHFDAIDKISCAVMRYPPLTDDIGGSAGSRGIAFPLLKDLIFNYPGKPGEPIEVATVREVSDWSEAFEALKVTDDSRVDMLLTPAMSTRRRMQGIYFSVPIFYVEVGLFMRRDTAVFLGIHEKSPLSYVIERVSASNKQRLRTIGYDGEISHELAERHFGDVQQEEVEGMSASNFETKILKKISGNEYNKYISFLEVPKVKYLISSDSGGIPSVYNSLSEGRDDCDIVNVMKENALVYPVCFAVRHGRKDIVDYINLRIMNMHCGRSMNRELSTKADQVPHTNYGGLIDYLISWGMDRKAICDPLMSPPQNLPHEEILYLRNIGKAMPNLTEILR